jgi:hypothetical protein
MSKRERVPGTKSTDPMRNREQRRHPERVEDAAPGRREAQEDVLKFGSDDDVSVRAKSSGHKKKTADKWNQ